MRGRFPGLCIKMRRIPADSAAGVWIDRDPMKPFWLALIMIGSAFPVSAYSRDILLPMGSDAGQPALEASPDSAAELFTEPDQLVVRGPNFWSIRWQFNKAGIDLTHSAADDALEIEVSLATADTKPFIEIVLVNSDWSGKAIYRFDIPPSAADAFVKVRSTTRLAEPVRTEGEFSPLTQPVGAVQFLTKAESGNSPWEVRLKSLSLAQKP